jgi:hypothetical protein
MLGGSMKWIFSSYLSLHACAILGPGMNSELTSFVHEALRKNIPRNDIRKILLRAKWSKEEIDDALENFLDADFPLPVPYHRPYLSAKEAYLYMVMFLMLYFSAISFGVLLFQFINRWYPDPVMPLDFESARVTIRWNTATLVIAFPVFLYVRSVLQKGMALSAAKRASKIRKWLTYATLFVAAGIIITDLIVLLFGVLGGELTMRFIWKVVVIGTIALVIFGSYLSGLRREES